jgi:hypothetical protein
VDAIAHGDRITLLSYSVGALHRTSLSSASEVVYVGRAEVQTR